MLDGIESCSLGIYYQLKTYTATAGFSDSYRNLNEAVSLNRIWCFVLVKSIRNNSIDCMASVHGKWHILIVKLTEDQIIYTPGAGSFFSFPLVPVLIANGKATGSSDIRCKSISSNLDELHNCGGVHSQKGTSADASGMSSTPMWKIWSRQRVGSPAKQFEATEVFPNKEKHVNHNSNNDVSVDGKEVAGGVSRTDEESKGSHTDNKKICQNQIHLLLRDMESELTSSLHLIRSRSKGYVSHKDRESLLKEMHRLSDELEFKETEVMNANDILRSTRAKLAIQQGKMTHAIIEAQRLDAAQKALRLIHTICIVWPSSASEVLLAGSFDGWTSQRRMERSKSGMFSLHLKMYPGRYEIKFIVDGVWMVDRLRPTIWNNGYENNLLLVP